MSVSLGARVALARFEAALVKQDAAPSTRRAYVGDVRRFVAWLAATSRRPFEPAAVTPMDVGAYRDSFIERGKSPHALKRALAAVRGFFEVLVAEGVVPDSPAEEIRPVAIPRDTAPKALSAADVNALLRKARTSGFPRDRVRNTTIVQLLALTGLRLGELVALRWSDVAMSERKGSVRVRAGKGLKERSVPLNATARAVLRSWRKVAAARARAAGTSLPEPVLTRSDGRPLAARGVQHVLGELAARAQIEPGKVTPHAMRHTMATMFLARHPGDVVALAALLGHASIATTAIYTKPSAEDLAAKMEAHPLNYAR